MKLEWQEEEDGERQASSKATGSKGFPRFTYISIN